MKIVGLITEYNPFHNGHLYHIKEALRVTGADAAIVVMSGDYVQRGMPAIMPKRLRAEMALKCGAAAVFELPVCYATGSAEYFATGAVSLLSSLGIVDCLCFGSECNDLSALSRIADILLDEPLSALDGVIKESIKEKIKEIARDFHLTTIIVTHDPEEALTLSDKVLIVNQGHISQYGAPEEIITAPSNNFVKEFILNQLEIKRNNIFALFHQDLTRNAQAV